MRCGRHTCRPDNKEDRHLVIDCVLRECGVSLEITYLPALTKTLNLDDVNCFFCRRVSTVASVLYT